MAKSSFAVAVLIVAIVFDTVFSNIPDIIASEISMAWRAIIFGVFAIVAASSGVYLLSTQTKRITNELGLRSHGLLVMTRLIHAIQYAISALLVFIAIQIVLTSQYSTILMIAIISLGYLGGSLMTGLLSYKFLQWYKSNRDKTILLYLMSSLILSALLMSTIVAQSVIILRSYPSSVEGSDSLSTFPTQQDNDTSDIVSNVLTISYLVAFVWLVLTWVASATMLNRYTKNMAPRKRWPLILSPMVAMTVVTVPWLLTIQSASPWDAQLIIYRIVGISAILAQGFLAAFAFLVISRNMRRNNIENKIVNYIEISALGIALLFISMPANIAVGAFPPFGTISYSLVALGAYIFLAGIYSSAISASADVRLRRLMRKSFKESGLIDNIGFANLNHELQKQVTDLLWTQRDIIRKETDVESFSISESDIKKYMDQVLYENKDHLHRIAKHGEATISREGNDTQKGDSTAA